MGRVSHPLLKTRFPAPLTTLRSQLLQTGQWEGELVHFRRDGSEVIVASQWILHRTEQGRPVDQAVDAELCQTAACWS